MTGGSRCRAHLCSAAQHNGANSTPTYGTLRDGWCALPVLGQNKEVRKHNAAVPVHIMTGSMENWAQESTEDLFGWSSPEIFPLSGSSETGNVVRVRSCGQSAVLKRYSAEEFQSASVVTEIQEGPFARVIGCLPHQQVLAFEDVGDMTLGDRLIRSNYLTRRDFALEFVRLVDEAHTFVDQLGSVNPPETHFMSEKLGIPRPTKKSRHIDAVSMLLSEIGSCLGTAIPRDLVKVAEDADREADAWVMSVTNGNIQYILGDTNPHNIIKAESGRSYLVDVCVKEGITDVDLVPLGGLLFSLEASDVEVAWHSSTTATLDRESWWTLNGIYSVTSLCDTLVGLREGSRDGTQGVSSIVVTRRSLEGAVDALGRGVSFGQGWIPAILALVGDLARHTHE